MGTQHQFNGTQAKTQPVHLAGKITEYGGNWPSVFPLEGMFAKPMSFSEKNMGLDFHLNSKISASAEIIWFHYFRILLQCDPDYESCLPKRR